VVKTYIVDQH